LAHFLTPQRQALITKINPFHSLQSILGKATSQHQDILYDHPFMIDHEEYGGEQEPTQTIAISSDLKGQKGLNQMTTERKLILS
jgi:hypothetical protein